MMDGGQVDHGFALTGPALDIVMPMHLCLSNTGHITACGPTLAKLFPGQTLIGARFFELFELRRPSCVTTLERLRETAGQRLYLSFRSQTGTPFRGVATPLADGRGILVNLSFGIGIIDAVRDHGLTDADFAATDLAVELLYVVEAKSAVMDELRQLNLRLQGAKNMAEELALTDTLTGLRNRRALDLMLERVLGAGVPFALIHLDLDFFKAVNDTLGHAAGDFVLREVARVLSEETRAGDTVARVGGDEFVLVLPNLSDPVRLSQIAARIIAKLGEPMMFDGRSCKISGSIGMTLSRLYPKPDIEQMLADTDAALYASKRAGRGVAMLHGKAD